jgi:antitoxin YefM
MMQVANFSKLRNNLKEIMTTSMENHEPVIIRRPHGNDMILLSLRDYEALKETVYLLGNEANAKHLRRSLDNVSAGQIVARKLVDE